MAADTQGEWYFTRQGEQLGPVAWAELQEFVKLGGLHPRTDMVWKSGMESWVAAGEIDGLFERRAPDEPQPGAGGMAATAASVGPGEGVWDGEVGDSFERSLATPWPGVGRLGYFFANLILPLVGGIGLAFLQPLVARTSGPDWAQYVPWLNLGFMAIALYATVMRFPNLGMSKWWTLGFLVPILQLWVGYRCFACPAGYAINKRLDGIGWVLAVVYWLTVVATIVAIVVLVVTLGAALADPELWQRLQEQIEAATPQGAR